MPTVPVPPPTFRGQRWFLRSPPKNGMVGGYRLCRRAERSEARRNAPAPKASGWVSEANCEAAARYNVERTLFKPGKASFFDNWLQTGTTCKHANKRACVVKRRALDWHVHKSLHDTQSGLQDMFTSLCTIRRPACRQAHHPWCARSQASTRQPDRAIEKNPPVCYNVIWNALAMTVVQKHQQTGGFKWMLHIVPQSAPT